MVSRTKATKSSTRSGGVTPLSTLRNTVSDQTRGTGQDIVPGRSTTTPSGAGLVAVGQAQERMSEWYACKLSTPWQLSYSSGPGRAAVVNHYYLYTLDPQDCAAFRLREGSGRQGFCEELKKGGLIGVPPSNAVATLRRDAARDRWRSQRGIICCDRASILKMDI